MKRALTPFCASLGASLALCLGSGSAIPLRAATLTLMADATNVNAGDEVRLSTAALEPWGETRLDWSILENNLPVPGAAHGPLVISENGRTATFRAPNSLEDRTFVIQVKCGLIYAKAVTLQVAGSGGERKDAPGPVKRFKAAAPPAEGASGPGGTTFVAGPVFSLLALPDDLAQHLTGFACKELREVNHDFSVMARGDQAYLRPASNLTDSQLYQLLFCSTQVVHLELNHPKRLTAEGIMAALLLRPELEALTLIGVPQVQGEQLRLLAETHPRLNKLNINLRGAGSHVSLSFDALAAFSDRLTSLTLDYGHITVGAAQSYSFPNLVRLALCCGEAPIPELQTPALKYLTIECDGYRNAHLPDSLEELEVVAGWQFELAGPPLPRLKNLRLMLTRVTEEQVLRTFRTSPELEKLVIDIPLSRPTLRALPAQLSELQLDSRVESQEGPFRRLDALVTLHLSAHEGFRMEHCPPNLRKLYLGSSSSFEVSGRLPALEELTVQSCPRFRMAGLAGVLKSLLVYHCTEGSATEIHQALQDLPQLENLACRTSQLGRLDRAFFATHPTLRNASISNYLGNEFQWKRPTLDGFAGSDGSAPLAPPPGSSSSSSSSSSAAPALRP